MSKRHKVGPNQSMIGRTYKNLIVLSQCIDNPLKVVCLCLLCNKECVLQKTSVCSYKQGFSCRECAIKARTGEKNKNWSGHGQIHGKFMYILNRMAKKRNLPCTVTISYLDTLLTLQNNKCKLSGIDILLTTESNKEECTASLDRIDSSKGYIEGNVQWVHKYINRMKSDFPDSVFIEFCKKVSEYNDN